MSGSNFILQRLREKFSSGEEVDPDSLTDLNYKVGNTSGMDVTADIPSELAERVGQLAQRAGGEMEIQVTNPSTFFIDREDLYNSVNGLDIDFSIHSDPNVGYTSPYQVGEGGGFDGTFNYFTQYLQAFTSFKLEAENRSDLKLGKEDGISIGRINPHVSVSPLPQTEQERAQGVGLDPFGYNISKFNESIFKQKSKQDENIWANPEFLRRFYRMFVRDELEGNEWRYFEGLYNSYSNKFDREWKEAKNEILNDIWEDRTGTNGSSQIKDKAEVISIAARAPAVKDEWLELLSSEAGKLDDGGFELPPSLKLDPNTRSEAGIGFDKDKIEDLEDLDQFIKDFLSQRYAISEVGRVQEFIFFMQTDKIERMIGSQTRRIVARALDQQGIDLEEELTDIQSELWEKARPALIESLNKLWNAEPREENDETKVSLIPVETKTQAVSRQLEVPNERIPKRAFDRYGDELKEEAEELYSRNLDYFREKSEGEEDEEKLRDRHRNFLEDVVRQFQQQMWQESNLFYRLIPAWLDVAHQQHPGHEGWRAPNFLWKFLVEEKWGERENVELDLTRPQSSNGDTKKRYFDLLEDSREFQMDVAAAVGGTYMWSMFTQVEGQFELDGNEYFDGKNAEEPWIDWMNRYGIGINMETMAGQPRQYFKLWRPVHVVAACRAVNITARERLEEGTLGDKAHMAPELDDCPVKFTIDMEHVSSFGVDPLKEMKIWKDREKKLLENPIEVGGEKIEIPGDPERPLAKMLRMYHLTKPGHETSGGVGHTHGPFRKGDKDLYRWLYNMVIWGFTRTGETGERASVMYEVGGEQVGTVYQAKLAMDLIELGVDPEELDPSMVDPGTEYESEKEALIARFFDMDRTTYSKEWAKIEQHAFDPLDGLLEAETFDVTFSGSAALENNNRINDFLPEEYQ